MDKKVYPVPSDFKKETFLDQSQYQKMYKQSIDDPNAFWSEMAEKFISWQTKFKTVLEGDFSKGEAIWFKGGKLNVSFNCLDRHLKENGDKTAIIWQGDDPKDSKTLSYKQLHEQVCQFANVLKKLGIEKGDKVCIYLPMIPEIVIVMLACTRIGAVHSVVFAGFSPESLKVRIQDAECKLLITADEGLRGGKTIPLKENADAALKDCPDVEAVIVVKRTGGKINWQKRDKWYADLMAEESKDCKPVDMDATDPLFILYTSGSTGKPKGILHTTGGYLVHVATTFKYIFDYHDEDIYWCTADCGWVTGHSYLVYGPLCNGATTLIFEGVPNYPDFSRYWQIVDHYKVNILYTSPTAIRAIRKEGDQWLEKSSLKSLKLLGTVGEPINPEVWEWYYEQVGKEQCPIVDTWWQTETGGILISPLPGATDLKPGSASWPFFGVVPAIVDDKGETIKDDKSGKLVITKPWPGMMKSIYKNHERYIKTYFTEVPGAYLTGDGACRDKDGYFWISGRNDDVIKVSGHRIGTEEVESALLTHESISEAAVVAVNNDIKGQAIYAFVTPKGNVKESDALKKELIQTVRTQIGPIATPEAIQWAKALPKTRSGKIMRRILRKIANDETEDLGDLSTLVDPSVIDDLISQRQDISQSK